MDIAKYIGLFLLKNNYCCLQGLGNLEIRKRPASQQEGQLNAPQYEAMFSQTGSIDDALANFIATNESVSIAKASNEIREFISYAKAELAAGNDVLIPSVGKYTPGGNGMTRFELDPAFSLPGKPVIISAPVRPAAAPELAYQESSRQSNVNWGLITLWSVILLVVGSILFFGIRYMTQQSSSSDNPVNSVDSQMVEVTTPATVDTTAGPATTDSMSTVPAVAAGDTPSYNFVIGTYKSLSAAQRREKQLNGYGHQVSVMTQDSAAFYVVKSVKTADTLYMKDSLSKVLNPSGVTILQ